MQNYIHDCLVFSCCSIDVSYNQFSYLHWHVYFHNERETSYGTHHTSKRLVYDNAHLHCNYVGRAIVYNNIVGTHVSPSITDVDKLDEPEYAQIAPVKNVHWDLHMNEAYMSHCQLKSP